MLVIPGQTGNGVCDRHLGVTRRDLLRVGGSAMLGMTLGNMLRLQEAHASGPDQEVVRAVKNLLPAGWSVRQDADSVVVSRDQPVEYYCTINLPANTGVDDLRRQGFVHKICYAVTLRFGERITPEKYAQLVNKNAATAKRLEEMRDSMRHITHKFSDYLPNTAEDKRLVDAYQRLAKSLHELPDHYSATRSVWTSETVDWACAFASDERRCECRAVRDKVLDIFHAYPRAD